MRLIISQAILAKLASKHAVSRNEIVGMSIKPIRQRCGSSHRLIGVVR